MACGQYDPDARMLVFVVGNHAGNAVFADDEVGNFGVKMDFPPCFQNTFPHFGNDNRQLVGADMRVGVN
ncbi:hypothetical protein D3C87_1991370 [compost metagenome]